jgi:hypothetical protein
MARLLRIVVVNIPHHVTQRGNAKQFILTSDAERVVYLELLQQYVKVFQVSLLNFLPTPPGITATGSGAVMGALASQVCDTTALVTKGLCH